MALTSVRNQSTVVDEETDEDRGQTLRSLHSFSPQRLSVFLVDVFVLLTTETPAMSGDISVFFFLVAPPETALIWMCLYLCVFALLVYVTF